GQPRARRDRTRAAGELRPVVVGLKEGRREGVDPRLGALLQGARLPRHGPQAPLAARGLVPDERVLLLLRPLLRRPPARSAQAGRPQAVRLSTGRPCPPAPGT